MRSLATSDRAAVRAISGAIARLSNQSRAREFLRIVHRMGADPAAIVPVVRDSPNFRNRRFEGGRALPATAPPRPDERAARVDPGARTRHARSGRFRVVRPALPEQAGELAVTWYGHATTLLEIDGARLLIDPVFRERVSPIRIARAPSACTRCRVGSPTCRPSTPCSSSHDHYDHLD